MDTAYIITYDAHKDTDYDNLYAALRSYKLWAKVTESTWVVLTENKATEIRDHIDGFLPAGSRVFVLKSGKIAAWRNVICSNEWLKKNL